MVKYEHKGKYHDVLICEACEAVHIDDEECINCCVRCEACKKMVTLMELDDMLLLEAEAEICKSCAGDFLEELVDYKTKYPITHAENENKPIMGDHKGRT